MENFIPVLKNTTLFANVSDDEIITMTNCLHTRIREYQKDEYVFRTGDYIDAIAILVRGSLLIQKGDYWGNRSIVNKISVGEIFGEAYAMQDNEALLNDVLAIEDSTVLMFNVKRVMNVCSNACEHHTIIIQNLIRSISHKNIILTQKIDCMAQRSTREKLTAYLSAQSKKHGNASFDIPFNRQQLADFLSVDRSAMSNELCKMRDDGMLKFNRNHFELIQKYND
ncbi:MAG: Crp/Fnr family transcriptional regulator [Acutalibacteraceae bacterium]